MSAPTTTNPPVARSAMRATASPLLTLEQAVDIADDFARRLQLAEAELATVTRDVRWLPVKRRARAAREHTLLTLRLERRRIRACLARHGFARPAL